MKEVNLTGDQVNALTKEYLTKGKTLFLYKSIDLRQLIVIVGSFGNQVSPIIHPDQVAGIQGKLKLDAVTVACGLHDAVEDTDATPG